MILQKAATYIHTCVDGALVSVKRIPFDNKRADLALLLQLQNIPFPTDILDAIRAQVIAAQKQAYAEFQEKEAAAKRKRDVSEAELKSILAQKALEEATRKAATK